MGFVPIIASVIGAAAAVVGVAQQRKQAKAALAAQNAAQAQNLKIAREQQKQADASFRSANQKQADVGGIREGNARAERGGSDSTMLTGPGGIDQSLLALGKQNTLLGG